MFRKSTVHPSLGFAWAVFLIFAFLFATPYFLELSQRAVYWMWPAWGIAALAITYSHWNKVWQRPNRFSVASSVMAVVSIACGWGLGSNWLIGAGWFCAIIAFLMAHEDARFAGKSLIRILPCWLILVRLPTQLSNFVDESLWKCVSAFGSPLLNIAAVPHRFTQTNFELRETIWPRPILLEHAYSVIPMISLALIWFAYRGRLVFLLPLQTLAAGVWAIAAVVAQVFVKAFCKCHYDFDMTIGIGSQIIGFASIFVAALLILSSERMLRVIMYPVTNDRFEFTHKNPLLYGWNRLFLGLAFARKQIGKENI